MSSRRESGAGVGAGLSGATPRGSTWKSDATRPPSRGSLSSASVAGPLHGALGDGIGKLRTGRISNSGDGSVLTSSSVLQTSTPEAAGASSDMTATAPASLPGSSGRSIGRLGSAKSAGDTPGKLPAGGDLWTMKDQYGAPVGEVSRSVGGVVVTQPAWNQTRPFLTGMYLTKSQLLDQLGGSQPAAAADLLALSLEAAESLLVDDLLSALSGIDGTYIRSQLVPAAHQGGRGAGGGGGAAANGSESDRGSWAGPRVVWRVAVSLEPALKEQVERLLPLAECVAAVMRFVETRASCQYGKVAQALGAAMRAQLEGWLLRVTQLEALHLRGQLTLAALGFYCQGPAASLELMADTAVEAACTQPSAAGLLNLLQRKAASLAGDREGRALVQGLLAAGAAPYFDTLQVWLTSGQLDDPYAEFMIQEDVSITKDALTADKQLAFWAQRYTVRRRPGSGEPDVPLFLRDSSDDILNTGKYLHAIRECGQPVVRPLGRGVRLAWDPSGGYLAHIQAAYEGASSALLQFMMRDVGLLSWLRSIKHFFLLDQGDVLVHLMESAREELVQCVDRRGAAAARLQYCLEAAVRSSSVADDPHADIMHVKLEPRNLMELLRAVATRELAPDMSAEAAAAASKIYTSAERAEKRACWEMFVLKFSVSWPVSLVVSHRQLLAYQMIFRRLFELKYVERQLTEAWAALQPARGFKGRSPEQEAFKLWHAMCSRFLHFVQEYLRYLTVEVLEPLWQAMEAGMRKAANVDEVMARHEEFLQRALRAALLDNHLIIRGVSNVLSCAADFCSKVKGWLPADADQPAVAGGGKALRGSLVRRQQPLLLMAREPNAAQQMQELHSRFKDALGKLLLRMSEHCNSLLKSAPEHGLQAGEGAESTAAMTTREEVESLDNLISRLTVTGAAV